MKKLLSALIIALAFVACTSSENDSVNAKKDPYFVMHVVFEGEPDEDKIKTLMEAVLMKYNMESNDDNALKVGNMLVVLRQSSVVGVTEMQILKHIYQSGSSNITLSNQAGLSAAILELNN